MKTSFTRIAAALGAAVCVAAATGVQAQSPAGGHVKLEPREGDFTVKDFRFADGEIMPSLRLHYMTLGTPRRDAQGHVVNAVLIMHGTGGDGHQFERPQFADVLFAPGGLLDPARYYIILPDDIGHGHSSKPSDGLRAHFPKYGYHDMVEGEYELVTQGLHVDHLRLVMGTSMGCMHSFMWGEIHPDMMDALMPLACEPVQIAGRNRIWREMLTDAIVKDPAWKGGDYTEQPQAALRTASDIYSIAGSAPLQMQKAYPTREAADAYVASNTEHELAILDANDTLYQVNSSRDYDPSPDLEKIKAPVMWINSADDFINPPELGISEREVKRIRHGTFVLIPASLQTHGHGTHTWAAVWQNYMRDLLKATAR
jgi:homoserine O-acetyltransferase